MNQSIKIVDDVRSSVTSTLPGRMKAASDQQFTNSGAAGMATCAACCHVQTAISVAAAGECASKSFSKKALFVSCSVSWR